MTDEWFWCVLHRRAEQGDASTPHSRVGPFFTKAEAEDWDDALVAEQEARP